MPDKDVTCPHCGFIFQVEERKKKEVPETKKQMVMTFIRVWNAFAKEKKLPEVRESNTTIQAKALSRLTEAGFAEDFQDALKLIATDSFFRGMNDRKWTADLEYMLRPGKVEQMAQRYRAAQVKRESANGSSNPSGASRLLPRARADEGVPQEP